MSLVTCHSLLDYSSLLTLWASCSPACAAEVEEYSSHFELVRVEHVSLKSHEKAECAQERMAKCGTCVGYLVFAAATNCLREVHSLETLPPLRL